MKILIIQLARLGDIYQSWPTLKAVKRANPGAEIHFLTRSKFAAAAPGPELVDRHWKWVVVLVWVGFCASSVLPGCSFAASLRAFSSASRIRRRSSSNVVTVYVFFFMSRSYTFSSERSTMWPVESVSVAFRAPLTAVSP